MVVAAHTSVFRCDFFQLFHVAAFGNPAFAHSGQSLLQVDSDIRVAERSAGVVNIYRRIRSNLLFSVNNFYGRSEVYFLHTYFYKRKHGSLHVGLFCVSVSYLVVFLIFHEVICYSLRNAVRGEDADATKLLF